MSTPSTCSMADCFLPATKGLDAMPVCRPCDYLISHPEIDEPDEIAAVYAKLGFDTVQGITRIQQAYPDLDDVHAFVTDPEFQHDITAYFTGGYHGVEVDQDTWDRAEETIRTAAQQFQGGELETYLGLVLTSYYA